MQTFRSVQRSAMFAGCAAFLLWLPCASAGTAKSGDKPSRAAEKGCAWEKFSDTSLHLDAWVQRCDFPGRKGFPERKIDFVTVKNSLSQRYSDSKGAPDPLVDVLDLKPGETPEAGIRRLFDERTDHKLGARCVLAPYREETGQKKAPAGVKRYTFVPDAALAKELKAKQDPNDVPEPPCGDWGYAPDGIQYWEAQPASGVARVLFVRVGQDEPLFDEATLRLR
ncbi:MAG TPA: hypothetical protein VGH80_00735 [Xanthomonadaceae bacterium]